MFERLMRERGARVVCAEASSNGKEFYLRQSRSRHNLYPAEMRASDDCKPVMGFARQVPSSRFQTQNRD
jgi:hypothetical protein